jgi:2-polyprenyl-6-methoxyphenol hydroxylase-like FAD-dependent oxidoreductase
MATQTGMRVLIIGAGTGGLCLAHGLKRAGIDVQVYERDRTRKDGLYGYRVGISPAGSYAMQQCVPPEVFDLFVATCARAPRYFNMLTEKMKEVGSIEMPDSGDPVDSEKSVSRMTLRQVLLTGLEDDVSFDKKFARYWTNEDGTVTALFEDGTTATGDVLVGADGASSKVRNQRLPDARMEQTGIVSIGGKVPMTAESRALVSKKVFEGISLIQAPRGKGAIIHVMEFPWRRAGMEHEAGGNDAKLVAEWPGLLYDNTQDYMMWGVWAALKNFPANPMKTQQQEQLRIAKELTAGWAADFRRFMELTDVSTVFSIEIRTSVPLDPWATSNVTLLGDAVHTMTPGRGVGANTALRDAALLCRQLIAVRDRKLELIPALAAYEQEMLRYSAQAVIESRKQMDARDVIHKPVIGRVVLGLMRTGMRMMNHVPALKRRMAESALKMRRIEAIRARSETQVVAG